MPIYAYTCPACGAHPEMLLRIDQADSARCPYCDGPMDRRLTAPADYRSRFPRPTGGKACCDRDDRCGPCGEGGHSGCCPTS